VDIDNATVVEVENNLGETIELIVIEDPHIPGTETEETEPAAIEEEEVVETKDYEGVYKTTVEKLPEGADALAQML
jgi:hypothetical protein